MKVETKQTVSVVILVLLCVSAAPGALIWLHTSTDHDHDDACLPGLVFTLIHGHTHGADEPAHSHKATVTRAAIRPVRHVIAPIPVSSHAIHGIATKYQDEQTAPPRIEPLSNSSQPLHLICCVFLI
jgi:hypothetical protein